MNQAVERLREVAPRWYAIGGSALLALVVIVVATTGGDRESLADGSGVPTTISTTMSLSEPEQSRVVTTTLPRVPTTAADIPATPAPSPTSSSSTTEVGVTSSLPTGEDFQVVVDADNPNVAARPIPVAPADVPSGATLVPPPWAATRTTTAGGHIGTPVGCVANLNSDALDVFFSERIGPVLGWDYQHVTRLGGNRYLWLFQDTFVDETGWASRLDQGRFVHNAALLQEGECFTLLHGGTAEVPSEFEAGDGKGSVLRKWFWPMGGDTNGNVVTVFWAEMVKDAVDPSPPNGLGWHPNRLFVATYDATTLKRLSFQPAPDSGVTPIYGYAVESDESYTYLFGNTFEQNLLREGGFWAGSHSATAMYLARVPLHRLDVRPEYRTVDGWSTSRSDAVPISTRFFVENPMQPRFLDGQWVSATAVDGYWGNDYILEVADQPWGPWQTVDAGRRIPRGVVSQANTYHAHVLPWRDRYGSVLIVLSANARDMVRHAYPDPARYRPIVFYVPFHPTPPPPTTTTTVADSTTTVAPVSTSSTSTTIATTTVPPTTTTTIPTTTTTTTTVAPSTTTSSTLAPTTTSPATPTTTNAVPPTTSTTIPPTSTTAA